MRIITLQLIIACFLLSVNALGQCAGVNISTHPANKSICASATTTFSMTSTNATYYQWEMWTGGPTWTLLSDHPSYYSGSNTNTLTVKNVAAYMNKWEFRCRVSIPACTSVTNSGILYVNGDITIHPTPKATCLNTATTFSVAATGTGLTYQWQGNSGSGFVNLSNGSGYSGVTTSTLNITGATPAMDDNTYRCLVTSCSQTTASNGAKLRVKMPPYITTQPLNKRICAGASTDISVVAGGENITYQWQANTGSGWNNISQSFAYSDVNTPVLKINNAGVSMNGYKYRCVITGECTPAKTSDEVTLTVNLITAVTTQPVSFTAVCDTLNISLRVGAEGSDLVYQWQQNVGGWVDINNSTVISGANDDTLIFNKPPVSYTGNIYRCNVSGYCANSYSQSSEIEINGYPNITAHPSDDSTGVLQPALFAVIAEGGHLKYQWQSNDGISGWVNLFNTYAFTGTDEATLRLPLAFSQKNGYLFRCVVSGPCEPADTSLPAMLTVGQDLTGINNITGATGKISVFPNPASGDIITLKTTENIKEVVNITIIDQLGRVIKQSIEGFNTNNTMELDISTMNPGIYTIKLSDNNNQEINNYRLIRQ